MRGNIAIESWKVCKDARIVFWCKTFFDRKVKDARIVFRCKTLFDRTATSVNDERMDGRKIRFCKKSSEEEEEEEERVCLEM